MMDVPKTELRNRIVRWSLIVLLAFLVWQALKPKEALPAGTVAPELSLALSTGEHFVLSQARGRPAVINFWASYCGPCRSEAPDLDRAYQRLKQKNVTFVGVSTDKLPAPRIYEAARELGMTFPIAQANANAIQNYEVQSIPTTFVVDSTGVIRWSRIGTVSAEDLIEVVAKFH